MTKPLESENHLIVLGAGAAGMFAAVTAKRLAPALQVTVYEASSEILNKVRISGGGRCNVTHACFDPRELVKAYPRGSRELLGPFHRFGPTQTVEWFAERGVRLKTEADGRMFPVTDDSQTIIDCLLNEARRLGVRIQTKRRVKRVERAGSGFQVDGERCSALMLTTGSTPAGQRLAASLGHSLVEPVPSLFTFNVPDFPLADLAGASCPDAELRLPDLPGRHSMHGPLLLTHWGFSGPAALKLSAWAARALHGCQYKTRLEVSWLPGFSESDLHNFAPTQRLGQLRLGSVPRKLWKRLLDRCGLPESKQLAQLSKQDRSRLCGVLLSDSYVVSGKTTHKEEFVTCGGVTLSEVDFRRMESRVCPGLYLAGELLNIDGVTGGFNFQNAWTGGWTAGCAIAEAAIA